MPHSHFKSLRAIFLLAAGLVVVIPAANAAESAAKTAQKSDHPALPPVIKQVTSPKAAAYYHYSLGHLYAEMAASYGNRSDYVNKAIDNYRLAMKDDPDADFLVEDIAELYLSAGRVKDAVEEAQNALKANPDQLNAHRVLAHIYRSQIGGDGQSRANEGMAKRALEQFQILADKDPKDIESLVMVGGLNRMLENSVDAEAAFKKALAVDPDNEDALVGLAGVYGERGDTKASTELLERLATKNPSGRAYAMLGQNYESMKEWTLAARALQTAAELEPTQLEYKAELARAQTLAGQYDDAIKVYQELVEQKPLEAGPYIRMAEIREQQNNPEEARKLIDKAKEIDKDSPEARRADALLLADEGKPAEAVTAMKGVLDLTAKRNYDPGQKAIRAGLLEELGGLYRRNEQYDLALDTFKQMGTLDPDQGAEAAVETVETYRQEKEYAKALQESDAALTKYPNNAKIRGIRAQVLSDQGKTDAAAAELKKTLDGKNDRDIYLQIAEIYQKGHSYADAAKALDSAEKLSQDDKSRANVLFSRGALYERQKKFDLAEKEFRKVLEADPKNASALNYLGYMLADQNVRLPEAQGYIQRAVDLEPRNYAFLDSLGWVYFRMNKLDDAEQQLSRSLQLMAKDPTIHDHLGDVYFKEGKTKLAIAQWQTSLKAWNSSAPSDMEPDEVAKVQKKLDSARVRLAKEEGPARRN
jgi:tetratricopeptide (TPR) repeat protein